MVHELLHDLLGEVAVFGPGNDAMRFPQDQQDGFPGSPPFCRASLSTGRTFALAYLLGKWQRCIALVGSLKDPFRIGSSSFWPDGCCWVIQWTPPPPFAIVSIRSCTTSRSGNASATTLRAASSARASPNFGMMIAAIGDIEVEVGGTEVFRRRSSAVGRVSVRTSISVPERLLPLRLALDSTRPELRTRYCSCLRSPPRLRLPAGRNRRCRQHDRP